MLPQTLLFLRYEIMITQDITKINSTFKNFSFNDILPQMVTDLTKLGFVEAPWYIRKLCRQNDVKKQAQSTENTDLKDIIFKRT